MIEGIVITAAEDSAIFAWSMADAVSVKPKKVELGIKKNKKNIEDRYFKPY